MYPVAPVSKTRSVMSHPYLVDKLSAL